MQKIFLWRCTLLPNSLANKSWNRPWCVAKLKLQKLLPNSIRFVAQFCWHQITVTALQTSHWRKWKPWFFLPLKIIAQFVAIEIGAICCWPIHCGNWADCWLQAGEAGNCNFLSIVNICCHNYKLPGSLPNLLPNSADKITVTAELTANCQRERPPAVKSTPSRKHLMRKTTEKNLTENLIGRIEKANISTTKLGKSCNT